VRCIHAGKNDCSVYQYTRFRITESEKPCAEYDAIWLQKRDRYALPNNNFSGSRALLKGYGVGYMAGKTQGMPVGMAAFYKSMGEHGITIEDKKKNEIVKDAVKAQIKEVPDPNAVFPKPYEFYYDELTSFYQAYPLCKGVSFDILFLKLASVWANWPSEYKTLRAVGENCEKLEK
jgi:hypothetical protein